MEKLNTNPAYANTFGIAIVNGSSELEMHADSSSVCDKS
jgi:hypothetical protein